MTTVVLTGTGTEVGKTWWGRATIDILRAAASTVAARKPAQSYSPDELGATDAEILGRASGEPAETVCPRHRWYPVPMAPPMAADALGLPPFTIADLVAEIAPPAPNRDHHRRRRGRAAVTARRRRRQRRLRLRARCDLRRVVLVARCRASGRSTPCGSRPPRSRPAGLIGARLVVALNRYDADDDLHRRNHGWLAAEGFHLVTTPAELAEALPTVEPR